MLLALIRRVGQMLFVMFGISVLVFLIFFATPGADPAARIAGRNASPEILQAVRLDFGLDKPLPVQYAKMMTKLFITQDLTSFVNRGWKVIPAVTAVVPVTLSLVIGGALLWMVGGILIGLIAAATSPITTPPTTHRIAAPTTSDSVTGATSSTAGTTFQPRLTNEVRSWVMKSRSIMSPYCTGSGRSKPKSLRTAASVSGDALRPAMRAAGSAPGVAKKMRNTRTLMPNMTNSIWPSRLTTAPSIRRSGCAASSAGRGRRARRRRRCCGRAR